MIFINQSINQLKDDSIKNKQPELYLPGDE